MYKEKNAVTKLTKCKVQIRRVRLKYDEKVERKIVIN